MSGDRMPRRWTDVAEDAAAWALIGLSLLTILAAMVVGLGAFGDTAQTERAADAGTPTTATVLESVPMLALEQPSGDVPARWTGPGGEPRSGIVTVVAGTNAGDEVPIWMDRTGARVPSPRTQLDAIGAAFLSGFAVLIAGETLCGGGWLLVRRVTAAANARRWAREWDTVGPSWTKQR
jgi:hypothetical protein